MPMTAREAIRLTKKWADASSGTERDTTFSRTRLAKEFPIPRHPGDLSPGVERAIKEKLGLL